MNEALAPARKIGSADGEHVFPVRVYFEDTDAGGVVYYANYFKYAERARTEMMRELGIESSRLMQGDGVLLAVRQCTAEYHRPARLDDQLEIRTRLLEVGGASLKAEQRVTRGSTDLVSLRLKLACVTMTGKPARLPKDLRASLENIRNLNRQG
jgi:acyl-CoA thioester hydrolase